MPQKQISRKKRVSRKNSNTKNTWEKFLNKKDSRDLLKKAWTTASPQKVYASTVRRLHKKYSSTRRS